MLPPPKFNTKRARMLARSESFRGDLLARAVPRMLELGKGECYRNSSFNLTIGSWPQSGHMFIGGWRRMNTGAPLGARCAKGAHIALLRSCVASSLQGSINIWSLTGTTKKCLMRALPNQGPAGRTFIRQ